MAELDLSRFGARIVVGAGGDLRLQGNGVMRRHAEIVLARNGGEDSLQVLRPLQGAVWVERRGRRAAVTADWVLADGDVIVIGDRRLRYRNLVRPPDRPQKTRRVSWLS